MFVMVYSIPKYPWKIIIVMKYTIEVLQEAVNNSFSIAQVLRFLGLKIAGGTHTHISRLIKKYEINTDHFTGQGHMRNKTSPHKKEADEVLIVLKEGSFREKTFRLKRALIEIGVPYICSECRIGSLYNDKPLVLQIDHIDGNPLNNLRGNLRFLCPNCHSQTETFCRQKSY